MVAVAALCAASFGSATVAEASFPGANGRIAYEARDLRNHDALYTMGPDGRGVQPFAHDFRFDHPNWSPTGEWLAAKAWRRGADEWEPLRVFSSSGQELWSMDLGPHFRYSSSPTWSPDARSLEYAELTFRHHCDIYIVEIGTRGDWPGVTGPLALIGMRRILDGKGCDGHRPEWSPNGEWILFDMLYTDDQDGIYLVRPDGSELSRIASSGMMPTWSPDGARIAYTDCARERVATLVGSCGIWIMNADGSNAKQVTTRPANPCGDLSRPCALDYAPTWSPDGRYILFKRVSHATHADEFWMLDLTSELPQPLLFRRIEHAPGGRSPANPDWQPLP